MEQKHILIVANRTATGEHLKRVVRSHLDQGPCRFTLLVPAAAPEGTFTWTEGQMIADASKTLDEATAGFRAIGAECAGTVGDKRPLLAIDDFLRTESADEIVVSTFPPGVSRWLRQDLPRRIRRTFDVPVTHVVDIRVPAHA